MHFIIFHCFYEFCSFGFHSAHQLSLLIESSLSGTLFHGSLLFFKSFLISGHLGSLGFHLSCSLFLHGLDLFHLLSSHLSLLFCSLSFSQVFKLLLSYFIQSLFFFLFCCSYLILKMFLFIHFFSKACLVELVLSLPLPFLLILFFLTLSFGFFVHLFNSDSFSFLVFLQDLKLPLLFLFNLHISFFLFLLFTLHLQM